MVFFTYIYNLLLVYAALTYFYKYPIRQEVETIHNNPPVFYTIPLSEDVLAIRWHDSRTALFATESNVYNLNSTSRRYIKIYTFENMQHTTVFSSTEPGILCTWENHQKRDPDDFGTTVVVIDLNKKKENEYKIVQTLKILTCSNYQLVLSEAFSFLAHQNYIYTLNPPKLTPTKDSEQNSPFTISGKEQVVIKDGRGILFEIKKSNNIRQF